MFLGLSRTQSPGRRMQRAAASCAPPPPHVPTRRRGARGSSLATRLYFVCSALRRNPAKE